jgi:hypothetical protein
MKLRSQIRLLQVYTCVLTVVLFGLLLSGFQSRRQKFDEIDVERINIVEADGKLRMTISNRERVPDPVINGKTYTGARKGSKSAGVIFFNDEGDECGGLAFSGKGAADQGTGQAGAALLFDQFHQDQTVGIMYSQSGERRSAGLHVWDRPLTPASVYVDRMQAINRMPEGAEKQKALDRIKQESARGELGMHRMFAGNNSDGTTGVTIADRLGKQRIALLVDQKNAPHLQFLDESGKVIYSIPPDK